MCKWFERFCSLPLHAVDKTNRKMDHCLYSEKLDYVILDYLSVTIMYIIRYTFKYDEFYGM